MAGLVRVRLELHNSLVNLYAEGHSLQRTW
jgi:hypothetical protein